VQSYTLPRKLLIVGLDGDEKFIRNTGTHVKFYTDKTTVKHVQRSRQPVILKPALTHPVSVALKEHARFP
jgi:hypothetical protein